MPSLMDTYDRSLLTFRFPRQTKAAELVHGIPPFAVATEAGEHPPSSVGQAVPGQRGV